MKQNVLENIIKRLDAILTTLYQDNILNGSSIKQKRYEAMDMLQSGRLKLVEELEEQETAQTLRSGECVECGRFSSLLSANGSCEGCVRQAVIDQEEQS